MKIKCLKKILSQSQTHPRCKYSKIDFGTNTKLCVPNPENDDDYFDIQNWVECHNLTNKPGPYVQVIHIAT